MALHWGQDGCSVVGEGRYRPAGWKMRTGVARRMSWMMLAGLTGLTGCGDQDSVRPLRLNLHQQWHLQPGMTVGQTRVTSGLGDLVLALQGQALYMPKAGRVEPLVTGGEAKTASNCVVVSSPEIPAYKLRLCHLQDLQLGEQSEGARIGHGEQVAVAMLRKQPEGTWAFVEPAPSLLEALLSAS